MLLVILYSFRGGSGVFTGRARCVLSNAIGNNGVLTGYVDVSGAALVGGYGFTAIQMIIFIPKLRLLYLLHLI
jgi:hypothetical protein